MDDIRSVKSSSPARNPNRSARSTRCAAGSGRPSAARPGRFPSAATCRRLLLRSGSGDAERTRGILLAALGYFVLPLDFVPDMLAMIGFSDDIAVLTAAFAAISGQIKERHYQKADEVLRDSVEK